MVRIPHCELLLRKLTLNVAAFLSALIVGISLHYHKIVENEHYGYPQEWFPSVSATIGDRYPERSFFMVFIAITSGARSIIEHWGRLADCNRPAVCIGRTMVPPHSETELEPSEIRCLHGHIPNFHMRWMDICYFHR